MLALCWATTLGAACGADRAHAEGEGGANTTPPDSAAVRAATEEKVRSLAQELARTAQQHGDDAVALQAALLIQAMRAGAVGATEVKVAGPSPREGEGFLELAVGTGLIFDGDVHAIEACNEQVWLSVAAPVLEQMERFDIKPEGLELVFTYGVQRFSDHTERKADPGAEQEPHTVRFVLPADLLADLASDRVSAVEARAACRSASDDTAPFGLTAR